MTMMTRILMSGAGFAAFAAAAPAIAQYAYPYGNAYNTYGTNMAAERCAAAVQNRLSYRNSRGTGIFGAILGANTYSNARVSALLGSRQTLVACAYAVSPAAAESPTTLMASAPTACSVPTMRPICRSSATSTIAATSATSTSIAANF